MMENPPNVLALKSLKVQDTVVQIPSYTMPQMKYRDDASVTWQSVCIISMLHIGLLHI